MFSEQLALALKYKRSASVHCIKAHGQLLKILKKVKFEWSNVILHSYCGNKEMTKAFLKLNEQIYFSFSLGLLDVYQIIPFILVKLMF